MCYMYTHGNDKDKLLLSGADDVTVAESEKDNWIEFECDDSDCFG